MEIENINIKEIIPYEKNPRKNEEAVEIVAKSIKEFGFQQPIIIDKNKVIIAGHTRLKAAIKLGFKEVPIVRAENLTPDQVKAFRLMDNKSHEYARWDISLLKEELIELKGENYNLDLTGFTGAEIDWLLGLDEEKIKLRTPKYQIKVGDIYQCGKHKVMCADSKDILAYDVLFEKETIKLCVTSPPYNMGKGKMYDNYDDDQDSQQYIDMNLAVLKNLMRYLKGYVFWNLSYNMNSRWQFIDIFYRMIHETDLKFLEKITWDKGHGMPISSKAALTREYEQILVAADEDTIQKEISYAMIGHNTDKIIFRKKGFKGLTNYWRISTENTQTPEHRAAFPLELPTRAIRLMTDEGDLVFDPFAGIGTTLIAAEKTNRKGYMVELDPVYCSFIIERWENLTGKKAKKL